VTKRALIAGITGQEGSYPVREKVEVYGMVRRTTTRNRARFDHLFDAATPHLPSSQKATRFLHYGDVTNASSINRLLREIRPDEIYNLRAQSHVKVSFEIPEYAGLTQSAGRTRRWQHEPRAIRKERIRPAQQTQHRWHGG
jgi:GDPmannose 4,6-dehydratase